MDAETRKEIHEQFKKCLYMKDGSLIPIVSEKRTICNTHLMLAHLVNNHVVNVAVKKEMLQLIEEAYDMGKRMDRGLSKYRNLFNISKQQGREQEKRWGDATT